jgi:hypothetical protein
MTRTPAQMTPAQKRAFDFLSCEQSEFEAFPAEQANQYDVFCTRSGKSITVSIPVLNFAMFWAAPTIDLHPSS